MNFSEIPIGFNMALAQNEAAMRRYSILTKEEKRALLKRAHNARSEKEMTEIVAGISGK